jgi:hypothetical protein
MQSSESPGSDNTTYALGCDGASQVDVLVHLIRHISVRVEVDGALGQHPS